MVFVMFWVMGGGKGKVWGIGEGYWYGVSILVILLLGNSGYDLFGLLFWGI